MSQPCSNTSLLNEYEHQQMLAERDLQSLISQQEREGIDPLVRHVEDMLECDSFYEHVSQAFVDNGLVKSLLVVLMCGDEDAGVSAARKAVGAMANLHAQRETDNQGGAYVPVYDSADVDPLAALQQLRDYIKELAA